MNNAEIEQRLNNLGHELAEIKELLKTRIDHEHDLTEKRFRDTSEILQRISSKSSHFERGVYEASIFNWQTFNSWDGRA